MLTDRDFGVKGKNLDRRWSHINFFCAILKATFIPSPWIGFFWVPLTPMGLIHIINFNCFLVLETCYHQKFTVPFSAEYTCIWGFFGTTHRWWVWIDHVAIVSTTFYPQPLYPWVIWTLWKRKGIKLENHTET